MKKEGIIFYLFEAIKKSYSALKPKKLVLIAVILALIGGLVFFSGGKQKTKAVDLSGVYIGPNSTTYESQDVNITGDVTIDGSHNFNTLTVKNGGTITTSPAAFYRKQTRTLDQNGFYNRSWAYVLKGYFRAPETGAFTFYIDDSNTSDEVDGTEFRIYDANNIMYRDYLTTAGGAGDANYGWPVPVGAVNAGPLNLVSGDYYRIELAYVHKRYNADNSPSGDHAKVKIMYQFGGNQDFNTTTQIFSQSGVASTAGKMNLAFYSSTGTYVKYQSNFDLSIAGSGATNLISLNDYDIFSAKAYFPKPRATTIDGMTYYERLYDDNGYLSTTDPSKSEDDLCTLNLAYNPSYSDAGGWKTCDGTLTDNKRFMLDFSSTTRSHDGGINTAFFSNPIGYISVARLKYTSEYYPWLFSGFYSKPVFDAENADGTKVVPDLPPLVIQANKLAIEPGGKIDVSGRGYFGGRTHYYGSQFTPNYSPAWSGYGLGAGQGGYFGGGNLTGTHQKGAGGGSGGRGGYVDGTPDAEADGLVLRPGKTYGDEKAPGLPGSGGGMGIATDGGNGPRPGGNGGGQVKIVVGELAMYGTAKIFADGTVDHNSNTSKFPDMDISDNSSKAGAGSGGSIDIRISTKLTWNVSSGAEAISAEGGSSQSGIPQIENKYRGVGGGGGRIYVSVPSVSDVNIISNATVDARCPAGYRYCGVNGTKIVEAKQSAAGPEIVKTTYLNGYSTAEKEATFEAGQKVNVELSIYEISDSRDDFKIEDMVSTVDSQVTYTFQDAAGGTKTGNATVSDGKVIFEGALDGMVLKKGTNTIRYSYKI